jgi:hypothetical protein
VHSIEVKHNESHSEYVKKIKSMEVDIIEEAEYIAKTQCEKRANATKSNDCCADCTKPKVRVPKKAECAKHGCSHTCAFFVGGACDAKGANLGPCAFPFEYKGKKYDTCINQSPFGKTKRPWCKVSGDKIGFCDCPAVTCTCPPGGTLAANGKTCNGVEHIIQKDVSTENGGSIDIDIANQGSKTSTHHKNKTSSHSEHHTNKTSSHSKSENATHKK